MQAAGPWIPQQAYHYVPVLWLAAAQPYAVAPAQPGPPATGLRTVGYKATLLVPQNLRLASATRRVRRGGVATLKGTLAVPVRSDARGERLLGPAGHPGHDPAEDRRPVARPRTRRADGRQRLVARPCARAQDDQLARLVAR